MYIKDLVWFPGENIYIILLYSAIIKGMSCDSHMTHCKGLSLESLNDEIAHNTTYSDVKLYLKLPSPPSSLSLSP